ncbi:MAG: AAA family ATPase [Brachymonas sp.]|nr:AAA family ATPase [Brachymonas sp.]
MSIPTFTFFNNKGGVGKTTLVYHVAHMLSLKGKKVLVIDCDPQANLSAAFLSDDELASLWEDATAAKTIYRSVQPMIRKGDFVAPELKIIVPGSLHLLVGDLSLSAFEDQLSEQWNNSNSDSLDTYGRAFDILTAFWRCAQQSAQSCQADLIIFDIGPNLGAINRSVLIGTDHIIAVLGADLFSLRGLQNIGPSLNGWRQSWSTRRSKPFDDYPLPQGSMKVLGYVAMQHQERLYRPVKAYRQWIDRIPLDYRKYILNETPLAVPKVENDPYCLALLRHYKSIVPISQEARKPMFNLKSADGVSGSQTSTVSAAYEDFEVLTATILNKAQASCGT